MQRDARTELGHPPRKISDRTLAEFTHGVCPSCYARVTHKMDHPGAGTAG